MGNKCVNCKQCQEPELLVHQDSKRETDRLSAEPPSLRYFGKFEAMEALLVGDAEKLNSERGKRARVNFTNGSSYLGEWVKNMRDGFGVQEWQGFECSLNNQMVPVTKGIGRRTRQVGRGSSSILMATYVVRLVSVDDGEWANNRCNGFGVYSHSNGSRYEGHWKDDKQDGEGKEVWADGSSYVGHYMMGQKHGIGKYIWVDGSYYDGGWDYNKIQGKGKYVWNDQRTYDGEWMENCMHGHGVYCWPDGKRYKGEYQYDRKSGYGVYEWPDGRRYEGYWFDGKQHGEGSMFYANGEVKKGEWSDGRWVK